MEKNYTQLFYLLSQKYTKNHRCCIWREKQVETKFFFSPTLENRGENVERRGKYAHQFYVCSRDGAGYRQ